MHPAQGDWIVIGRVVKPQGRKGEVVVEPLSDRPERFPALRSAFLLGHDGVAQPVTVSACWPHKGRFVLQLSGLDSIEAAERWRGCDLVLAARDLARLPAGTYYHHELVGLAIETEAGRVLGRCVSVMETGAAPVLVCQGQQGEELIPFAEPFIRRVDPSEGRILVELLETVVAQD